MAGLAAPLPLEKRTIPVTNRNGVLREAPAVHSLWCEADRVWTEYQQPPGPTERGVEGAEQAWLTTGLKVAAQLAWLLARSAHRFWSQISHDDGLHRWLSDLLEVFPREQDRDPAWSQEVKQTNQTILHRLFLVHVRLCTYKESQTEFFTPAAWGEMLYEKYLLELPKLLDVAALFTPCNPAITSKMVENVFRHQPRYCEDLLEASFTIGAALDAAGEQGQALSLAPPGPDSLATLEDLACYALDVTGSLAALVDCYPAAGRVLHQAGLELRLAGLHSSILSPLQLQLGRHASLVSDETRTRLSARLRLARHHTVRTVRAMVCEVCLAEEWGGPTARAELTLTFLTSLLSERTFLLDYNALYPVREELELLASQGAELDQTRAQYLLDSFSTTTISSFTPTEAPAPASAPAPLQEPQGAAAAAPPAPGQAEMDSLVSSVRDLLPHLGEGFVERVLAEYRYQPDAAINALLEESLPSHLASLDRGLARQQRPASPAQPSQPALAVPPEPEYRSVYDEDEFDVFSRDSIDKTRIHKGKKDKSKNAAALLEDKRDLVQLRDRFDRLGLVAELEDVAEDELEYDDEYDDTYDDVARGDREPDAEEDHGRGFVLPVALGGGKVRQERIIDAESESDEDEAGATRARQNFVRNPEEVRQEQERKRAEKTARRGKGGGGGPSQRDVVGRAKGQGQDKSVLIARSRKNANKGKGQRVGADKKASKGMF